MKLNKYYSNLDNSFIYLQKNIDDIFLRKNKIPDKVFNNNYRNFYFIEFADTISSKFGYFLNRIAYLKNDSDVKICVIDPDPVDYYIKNKKHYKSYELSTPELSEKYWDLINDEESQINYNSIFIESEICLWWGSQLSWGIWGIRGYEIAILASIEPMDLKNDSIKIFNIQDALDIIKLGFSEKNFTIPLEFREKFMENYMFHQ